MGSKAKLWLWNIYALCYDVILFSKPHQQLFRNVLSQIDDESVVADIGAGTGNLEFFARKRRLTFIAFDFSPFMLFVLRNKIKNSPSVRVAMWDMETPPPPSFASVADVAILINSIFATDDLAGLMKRINMMLKPSASLFIVWPKNTFSILEIVKEHARLTREDRRFGVLTLIGQAVLLAVPLFLLVLVNIAISLFANKGSYRNHSPEEVVKELSKIGFAKVIISETLSKQEYLAISRR